MQLAFEFANSMVSVVPEVVSAILARELLFVAVIRSAISARW